MKSQPEKLKDGSVLWHGYMHDVTERKLENIVAMERGQRLQAIFNTEPQCVKIIDLKGNLLDMNKAGLDMLEVSTLEEAKKYQLLDFILPEYQDDFRLLRKKVFSGEESLLEFEISGQKGTRRWLEEHAVPMYDDSCKVNGLLAIVIDITERKQAEARILRLTQLYKALSEVNQAIVRMEELERTIPTGLS